LVKLELILYLYFRLHFGVFYIKSIILTIKLQTLYHIIFLSFKLYKIMSITYRNFITKKQKKNNDHDETIW